MEIEIFEIPLSTGGVLPVPVEWRVSPKARSIGLTLPASGNPRLVLPPWASREKARAFFHTQIAWLLRALARREAHAKAQPPPPSVADYLLRVPWVAISGHFRPLECSETSVRPFFVFKRDSEQPVIFKHRGGDFREGDLVALLRGLAEKALPPRVFELAARVGVALKRVSVRDQRGRWGSCARTGTVSLNWRLMLLPPELQDHIILHELAHRREMNHSERFWNLLAQWDPDSAKHDKAVSKQWGWLMRLARQGGD